MFCESSAEVIAFIRFRAEADESDLSLQACLNGLAFSTLVVFAGSDRNRHVRICAFHCSYPFAINADADRDFARIEQESWFGYFYDIDLRLAGFDIRISPGLRCVNVEMDVSLAT